MHRRGQMPDNREITLLDGKAEKIYKKMQYHKLMVRKHKRLIRYYYRALIRLLGNEDLVKKILREYGKQNEVI